MRNEANTRVPVTAPPTVTAIDPVCGMKVNPATAKGGVEIWRGVAYAFCCTRCAAKFRVDPAHYVHPPVSTPTPPAAGPAIYRCPMDSEVVAHAPGPCPVCGMALEPERPAKTKSPDPELAAMKRRLVVSAALTVPLVAVEMTRMSELLRAIVGRGAIGLELALATPVVL